MVCSSMRLETAALPFMYIYIYLTNCFTGKTGQPRRMGTTAQCYAKVPKQDCPNVIMQGVAIRVKIDRRIKQLQNTSGITKTGHGAAVAADSVTAHACC